MIFCIKQPHKSRRPGAVGELATAQVGGDAPGNTSKGGTGNPAGSARQAAQGRRHRHHMPHHCREKALPEPPSTQLRDRALRHTMSQRTQAIVGHIQRLAFKVATYTGSQMRAQTTQQPTSHRRAHIPRRRQCTDKPTRKATIPPILLTEWTCRV